MAKRLVRLGHSFDDDYMGYVYVWVPAETSEEDLASAIATAQEKCLAAERDNYGIAMPPKVNYQPDFASQPERNVGDVIREHAAAWAEYRAAEEAVKAARRPFTAYLFDALPGCEPLHSEPAVEVTVNWHDSRCARVTFDYDPLEF